MSRGELCSPAAAAAAVTVIGAGLAGCEAAWAAARRGVSVTLVEMKPDNMSPAHKSPLFAELVCSNSLKAKKQASAAGLLKREMQLLGSLCVEVAYECEVPAGGALAVDREEFARRVTEKIKSHPLIEIQNRIAERIPGEGTVIIATGPLTGGGLSQDISRLCGGYLSFYDAASPIVTADSVDMSIAFAASRYGKGDADYINCPMNKDEYEAFYRELVSAQAAPLHEFDHPGDGIPPVLRDIPPLTRGAGKLTVYEGCMPVEAMAGRGADTLRFGPLKPVGLRDPLTGHRPWAAVQLRAENRSRTLFNLVGFQTNLKFPEQKRVFSMIPGLRDAEFVRYGVMHRNTFIDSPKLLDADCSLRADRRIFFAGQITGVEGYMESAACGIMAGINAANRQKGQPPFVLPGETMTGALLGYISDRSVAKFQPMGANFGILPSIEPHIRSKSERYEALANRALLIMQKL